ncbi:hemoglobin/transferrin/lactoferrin receptor protein [Alteromonadaceae bacterium Bs31]|nr:hemoglobin/transferrin/lactoferrin receptor protein [Alteromonadaceae bacterium Bs31]
MHILLKKNPLVLAIAACISTFASAEEVKPAIEEVQVWSTKVKASSLDLGEEAIAIRQADHISDLLRFIPGVDVGGAHSLNQRITIRSLDDKDLNVTIDGAVQNTYMFHHMGNLQIHSDILREADIEVGNNSVLSGSLGGVARFKTRSAKDMLSDGKRFGARINATYAANASERASIAGFGQLSESIDVLAYVNRVESDNYEVGGGEIKDSDGVVIAGTDGTVRGLEGSLTDSLLKVGFDITDNQRVKVGYEIYKDEGDYSSRPDMGLATDIAIGARLGVDGLPQLYPTTFTRDTATLNYDANFNNVSIEAVVFNNVSSLEREEAYVWQGSLVEEHNKGEATNTGASILFEQRLGGNVEHTLTYGLETVKYKTQYTGVNLTSNTSQQSREEAHSSAVYIQDRIALGNLSIIPGARFNHWVIDSKLVDKTYSEPTFALALEYAIDSATSIKLSTTELFKGPKLSEVFVGAGIGDVYNQDIKAETGRNTEIGISHQGQTFRTGLTAFDTQINDYIYDYINYTLSAAPYPKDNIGDMQLQGIEAFWGFTLDSLDVLLTYSDVNSELSAYEPYIELPFEGVVQEGFDGARTDRSYGSTYGLNIDYFFSDKDIHLHYDIMHVGSLPAGKDLDGAGLDNSKNAYTVHNVSAQWQVAGVEGLSITLGIDNIFDEYYASQASRTGASFHPVFGELYLTDYEPGRNLKASVAYQF